MHFTSEVSLCHIGCSARGSALRIRRVCLRQRRCANDSFVRSGHTSATGIQDMDQGATQVECVTSEGNNRGINFRSTNVLKPWIVTNKVEAAGHRIAMDGPDKFPHRVQEGWGNIKILQQDGVHVVDMWINTDVPRLAFWTAGPVIGDH